MANICSVHSRGFRKQVLQKKSLGGKAGRPGVTFGGLERTICCVQTFFHVPDGCCGTGGHLWGCWDQSTLGEGTLEGCGVIQETGVGPEMILKGKGVSPSTLGLGDGCALSFPAVSQSTRWSPEGGAGMGPQGLQL